MSDLEYTEHGWRMSLDKRRHHRENDWDYSGRGIYHLTLTVAEHFPLFGHLAGATPDEAHIELNTFGQQVLHLLLNIPTFYANKGYALKLLATQIMPDHIHFAIQALEPLPQSIGKVVRGFKSACTSLYKREYSPAVSGGKNTVKMHSDSPQDSTYTSVHFSRIFTRIGSIWQPDAAGYHDRILHHDGQLDYMIQYIKDNPRRLALKRANPDLFKIRQQIIIAGTPCTTLGNMFLIDYPLHAVIQCSRRLTQPEIDTRREACLRNAANGIIHVSAAISDGEQQICRALREAGHPLIILLTDGFPAPDSPHYRFYKPQGVYFEACAAGRLLLIEPSEALYEQPDVVNSIFTKTRDPHLPHSSLRYRFLALNTFATKIAHSIHSPSIVQT